MRRDDFLDRVLPGEITLLKKIAPCDIEGERWLKKTWIDHGCSKDTELRPVPILMSNAVIEQLNTVCMEKRVPRDAFIDCALSFFIERLYEAVIVIKNPRTTRDLVGQIADVLNDSREEVGNAEQQRFIAETVQEWWGRRNLEPLSDDFYKMRLSFDAARVTEEQAMLEALDLFSSDDPAATLARLEQDDSEAGSSS